MPSTLHHSLDFTLPIRWSANQENTLRRDYPFANPTQEEDDQYVIRTYLQFLWLPEVR
jgi:hypothetical protein